jgi:hypothetical protein
MLYVVLALLLAHLLLAVCHFQVHRLPWLLRQLFDLDQENNIPSWYSGTALFVTAVFVWLCAREKKALDDPWTRQWYVLTTVFFFLAVDEIAGLHETFNTLVDINWAIPGGVLAMALGFVLTPFLLHLRRRTAVLFAVSGIVYFGGAVVMELLSVSYNTNTLRYYMMTLWEEGLEMLGVVFFLYALLAYMSGGGKSSIRLSAGIKSSAARKSSKV